MGKVLSWCGGISKVLYGVCLRVVRIVNSYWFVRYFLGSEIFFSLIVGLKIGYDLFWIVIFGGRNGSWREEEVE